MFDFRRAALGSLAFLASLPVLAASANHVVTDFGNITLPFTHSIGDSFIGSQAGGFVTQDGAPVVTTTIGGLAYFYDDFVFSLPQAPLANFNAAAVSIDLGSFLSLQNFSARLYKLDSGLTSLTTGLPSSGTPIQSWTSSPLITPGLTGTAVLFQNVDLQAGATYTLEFRGTIAGAAGGSYGGNLNITPLAAIPEPDSAALLWASLGIIGMVSRRRFR
jgi:hypothetical protein